MLTEHVATVHLALSDINQLDTITSEIITQYAQYDEQYANSRLQVCLYI